MTLYNCFSGNYFLNHLNKILIRLDYDFITSTKVQVLLIIVHM